MVDIDQNEIEEIVPHPRIAYIVDDDGYVVNTIVVYTDDEYVDGNLVTVKRDPWITFWKPRWSGSEWVEGESIEDREKREFDELMESLKPSDDEIADAELEIKMITLLMEMGLI